MQLRRLAASAADREHCVHSQLFQFLALENLDFESYSGADSQGALGELSRGQNVCGFIDQ